MAAQTLFEKIWNSHVVHESPGEPALLYIDLHLIHEVTSPQAFEGLATAGRKVRRLDRTFATLDHNIPTADRSLPISSFASRHRESKKLLLDEGSSSETRSVDDVAEMGGTTR